MHCPKCGSEFCVKNGTAQGHQRYYCKVCLCNFKRDAPITGKAHKKRFALLLYLEGMPLREIARVVGTSHTTVQRWTQRAAPLLSQAGLGPAKETIGSTTDVDHLSAFLKTYKNTLGYGILTVQNSRLASGLTMVVLIPGKEIF